ncbi:ATP-binding protein [Wenyingzhuangia sp. IMCC45533]
MSERSFISFDKEKSLLIKYLELEKLRFRNQFSYQILGAKALLHIKIPTMIIQPFVENAIKHGLLHKTKGSKNIKIEFELKEVFHCTITDNGIGIEQSKKVYIANNDCHESFSTNAIRERLTLLKDYYQTDIGFEYLPAAIGTKVLIKIPYTLSNEKD